MFFKLTEAVTVEGMTHIGQTLCINCIKSLTITRELTLPNNHYHWEKKPDIPNLQHIWQVLVHMQADKIRNLDLRNLSLKHAPAQSIWSNSSLTCAYLYSNRQQSDGLLQVNNDLVSKVRHPEHWGVMELTSI